MRDTLLTQTAPEWSTTHDTEHVFMNFAVIADDSSLPRLLGVVQRLRGELLAVGGALSQELRPLGVRVWLHQSDELPADVDVVFTTGAVPTVQSAVPSLVRKNVAVWLVPEASLGSDFAYAQIPLDEEFPNTLRAVWPLRLSPAVEELRRQLVAQQLGAVLHLQMERVGAGGPSFTPETAQAAWLHDADLLRYIACGDYHRVTAIHSGLSSLGITTASVSLSGEAVPDAMWAYRAGGVAQAELTITTDRGAAVLLWDGDSAPTLTINCKAVELSTAPPVTDSDTPQLPIGVTPWSDAVRAFDLLDAAKRSLVRKRTVELQFESTSERSQFKTNMTTVGCSLLLLTMFGLMALLFVGRMFDPRDTQQKQSEVAGFVLTDRDFDGMLLSSRGQETVAAIAENSARRSATILIDGQPEPPNSEANQRRVTVLQALTAAQMKDAEVRTLVRPLQGVWFKRGMVVAWVLLFLPLGVLLVIQLLIGVTPGTASRTATSAEDSQE